MTVRVILASASPRRAELLRQIGLPFDTQPAHINEDVLREERPLSYVERMATEKAAVVAKDYPDCRVIGADTSVVLDQQILGKPADAEAARAMLQALSGRQHQVITSLCVFAGQQRVARSVVTDVTFRDLSDNEIRAYVRTGEPMDKAGSYGIQGLGGVFVSRIDGSYSAVVGLPLKELSEALAETGCDLSKVWDENSGERV